MTDKVLWLKIQQGDEKAFKTLFELHYRTICLYIVQFTNDIGASEDIVQNTFIKFWTKRSTIKITSSVRSYLFRSAYNHYLDIVRKEKRKSLLLVELKYQALVSQIEEEDSTHKERINRVKEIVETLPDRCKEILLLSKSKGLKNRQIAEHLDISIKTVESQIRIAFQKIRKAFDDNWFS